MIVKMPKLSLAWTYVMMMSVLLFVVGGGIKSAGYEILGMIVWGPGLLLWIALCFKTGLLFVEGTKFEDDD